MKKIIALALQLLFLFVNCIYGRTLSISNDPNRPAEFKDFASAMASASNGDTVLVYGSATSYLEAEITKEITLIGAGINTQKSNHFTTTFTILTISAVQNVSIDGVRASNVVGPRGNGLKIKNMAIKNSFIDDLSMHSPSGFDGRCLSSLDDMIIENCMIRMLALWPDCSPASNVIIKNSIIIATNRARNAAYINCIFTNYLSEVNAFINGQSGCSFTNCILNNILIDLTENRNLQFTNCLTFLLKPSATSDLNIPSIGFSATGTIINTSPLFASTAYPDNNNPQLWNPALTSASPAINSGTGNTQIGVYGGTSPFDRFYEPNSAPIVRNFFLENAVIPLNGILKITSTVTKAH